MKKDLVPFLETNFSQIRYPFILDFENEVKDNFSELLGSVIGHFHTYETSHEATENERAWFGHIVCQELEDLERKKKEVEKKREGKNEERGKKEEEKKKVEEELEKKKKEEEKKREEEKRTEGELERKEEERIGEEKERREEEK